MKKIFVVTYVMLVVCLAMPATTWGAWFSNGGGDGLWTNPLNWDTGLVPTVADGKVEIQSAVTLDSGTHSILGLEIYSDGTLIQTAGILNIVGDDRDSAVKIGDSSAGTIRISGTATFNMTGDEIIVGFGSGTSGTLKITGSGATINTGGLITDSGATGTLSLVMDAGGISPINARWGDNSDDATDLVVVLDAYDGSGDITITLMNIGGGLIQGAFAVADGAITYDDTELTEGTDSGSLSVGEYFIDYFGGDGNDVVLSVNLGLVVLECGDWGYHGLDRNKDCVINIADFAEFAQLWLACTTPDESGCVDMR
jgi:hypothetical protein